MFKTLYILWLKWARGCCRHWCFKCKFYDECHYGNMLEELKIDAAIRKGNKHARRKK